MPIQIDPNTGERVGTAPQIDPETGERVENVSTMTVSPPQQRGLLGSAADFSGLSSIGHAIAHPIQAANNVLDAGAMSLGLQKDTGQNPILNGLQQGIVDPLKRMVSAPTLKEAAQNVPLFGPTLAHAQEQHDAGNDAGMVGTLGGFVGGAALPALIGKGLEGTGAAMKVPALDTNGLKLRATRILAPGNPGQVLARALKPGVKYGADVVNDLNDTLKPILATKPTINGLSDFVDATGKAKEAQFQKYDTLRAPHMGAPIDTTPLVRAQLRSIPATDKFENPGVIQSTAEAAAPYDMRPQTKTVQSPILGPNGAPLTRQVTTIPTKPTLGKVDAIREDTNAKLNSFYNKDNGDRNAALSNKETARVKAVNDGTRDLVYKKLSDLTGMPEKDIRDMQKLYGNLSEVEKMAGNREVVFGRHDPVSLAEKVASGHGGPVSTMWNFGQQKLLRGLTDSDALIRSAVDRYQNPNGTPIFSNGPMSAPMVRLGNGASRFGQRLGTAPGAPSAALLLPKRKQKD